MLSRAGTAGAHLREGKGPSRAGTGSTGQFWGKQAVLVQGNGKDLKASSTPEGAEHPRAGRAQPSQAPIRLRAASPHGAAEPATKPE